jgi:hypothetical protein
MAWLSLPRRPYHSLSLDLSAKALRLSPCGLKECSCSASKTNLFTSCLLMRVMGQFFSSWTANGAAIIESKA